MPSQSLLAVDTLVKRFDSFTAVDGISFSIEPGEIVGLLGTNGAGKTTTIQMLLGLMTPTAGRITYFGQNFAQHRSAILNQVTFASTYVKLPGHLTVYENLSIYARLYDLNRAQRAEQIEHYLSLFSIGHLKDKETGVLSAGELARVLLAKAFIPNPKIVLLDEPTAALDPEIARDVREFVLEQQQQRGVSVLFTSHNMDEVTQVCDRVLVLKKGSIIANASPQELASSISTSHLELTITQGSEIFETYLQAQGLIYSGDKHTYNVPVDESKIPSFIIDITKAGVVYSHIGIEKPTLEDYFLHIAKQNRTSR